jgi:hypothetical protein
MRDSIVDSIIEFKEKNTNKIIPIENRKIIIETSKYASTKEPIYHLYINDIKLKKKSEYIITYKCVYCNSINSVAPTQILRKIRQNKTMCSLCAHEKLNSNTYVKIYNKPDTPKLSFIEFKNKSIIEFNNCSDLYKNTYFINHLSNEDYERLKSKIISFGNGKHTNINKYEFWPIYKVYNQMQFSSIFYDTNNNTIFKGNQPIVKCDNCEKNWRAKSIESLKKNYKILCKECNLCNRIFKIRSFKNINNDIIIYQSKLEKKFIEWANNNYFLITNGPYIKYFFNDKERRYRVDFQIKNVIIEIKDFHIWHKNQVESGVWQIKLDAVDKYIKEQKLERYFFITPHNWNQMIKELENIIK